MNDSEQLIPSDLSNGWSKMQLWLTIESSSTILNKAVTDSKLRP